MTPALPVWTFPFLLVLLGVALVVGHFSPPVQVASGVASLAAIAYAGVAPRLHRGGGRPVSNLLALLPGHLLLLFGVGTLARPDVLGVVWCSLPIGSVVYDWLSAHGPFAGRTSILAGLYAILWLVVFFLLERLIVLGKGIAGHAAIVTAVAFGAISVVFVVTGTIRHRRAVKE